MKKYLMIICLVCVALAMAVAAYATPIPGSINELTNGNFANGWTSWEHGSGLAFGMAAPGYGRAVHCNGPDPNNPNALLLRQVVDETKNPLWNWSMNQKEIDLMADIRCVWSAEGDIPHPLSTISFRFDWWGPQWNGSEIRPMLPTGAPAPAEAWSQWVTYGFSPNGNGIWRTVNPFVQDKQVLQWDGKPFQPRWLSVEVLIDQKPGERVWVDNLNLTAKCIPEPMSLVLGFMGLGSVVGLRRFVKK